MRRTCLWCLIMKKKEIVVWIHVYLNWKMTFNSKNGRKRDFSYETKASKSFIPMRRICLWCPIIKRNEVITWIRVYLNWQTNFESKYWWDAKFFLWNQSINPYIQMRRINLCCPIIKRKEIVMWMHSYSQLKNEL